ncbi:MAG: hypothetical protein LBG59_10040 [Candidatus Peribacteria bacterium]|jgi:hypothetical protein|nr:hypothetical protein [Candidatus Peribacteria bacterium]
MTQPISQPSIPNVAPVGKAINTLGIVALVLTSIGLLLTISLVGIFFGIPLLMLGLLLGIIAVFKKPRGKALTSIIIAIISLGTLSYAIYWIVDHLEQPMRDFSARIDAESETNIEFRLVLYQPGFYHFFKQHLQYRLQQLDWQSITKEYYITDNLTVSFERYIDFLIAEMQDEMFYAVDAWIQQYGIPTPQTEDILNEREVEDIIEIIREDTDENRGEESPEHTTIENTEGDTTKIEESIEDSVIQDVEALLKSLEE